MPVALFIYQHIYCRYLCPGECIVHDMGSEFCNKLSQQLHDAHDVEIRITSAGHPQSNGQAESAVKNIKAKMQAFMIEIGDKLFFSKSARVFTFSPCNLSISLSLSLSLSLSASNLFPMAFIKYSPPVFNKYSFPQGIKQTLFSPSHSVSILSPAHSANILSPGHSTNILSPGHSVNILSPGHSANILSPGHSVNIISPGHSVNILSPAH